MFRAIHDQIELVVNLEKALEMIERLPSQNRKAFNYEAQIAKLEEEIERYQKLKLRLYEDLSDGIIDKSEYADLSRRLDEAVQRRSKFDEAMSVDNKWITLMKSVSTATQLSQDLVDESVELVKVHEGGAVELVMKYGDIYELTIQSIKEVQEAM